MYFDSPLVRGTLLRRYKRFLADFALASGERVTAHCANPGAMTGLAEPGLTGWLCHCPDPRRKLAWRWELVEDSAGGLIGINTQNPNRLVAEALAARSLSECGSYDEVLPERAFGESSRVDFLLRRTGEPDLYLEVKNVHLSREPGLAEFPDTVTLRGARHLEELARVARRGARAAVLYVVQREDCRRFRLAADIDPAYTRAAKVAARDGVVSWCRAARLSREAITLGTPMAMTTEC